MGLFRNDEPGIRLEISARSDVGMTRGHNEDRYLVADLTKRAGSCDQRQFVYDLGDKGAVLLVADGMGGAAAGEVASTMATDIILEHLVTAWASDADSSGEVFERYAREAVEHSNAQIHHQSQTSIELDGMGTTVTLVGVVGPHLRISQVGDSRAYVVREGTATQITRDQSYVQHLIDTGRMSEEEAELMANNNIILQALGPSPTVEVVQSSEPILKGDVVVLCSDGLSGLVNANEIGETISSASSLSAACDELVAMANSRGGPDNITVVAARLTGSALMSPGDVVEA